jgi:hypothetical protein
VTFDTTPLERTCIVYGCNRPAVDPMGKGNRVHCATHDPEPPPARLIGQDPDTQEPETTPILVPSIRDRPPTPDAPPDMRTMEPYWNGSEWALRPKQAAVALACPHCGKTLEVQIR